MDIRNRKVQFIGLAAVIIIVVLLVVFIPGSDGGGTPSPTPNGKATSTPRPTTVPIGDSYEIYFTETGYQVSGAGQEFYTTINITPIELFFGAQFVLEWDCTLFELDGGWTQNNGHGRLYNGSEWVKATEVALNPTGDNPQCPDPKQGRVNFLVDWGDYYEIVKRGEGVNVVREGTLVTVGWRTHSGADYKAGTTDIRFVPKMKIVGYLTGAYEYTRPVYWHNTSVTLN